MGFKGITVAFFFNGIRVDRYVGIETIEEGYVISIGTTLVKDEASLGMWDFPFSSSTFKEVLKCDLDHQFGQSTPQVPVSQFIYLSQFVLIQMVPFQVEGTSNTCDSPKDLALVVIPTITWFQFESTIRRDSGVAESARPYRIGATVSYLQ